MLTDLVIKVDPLYICKQRTRVAVKIPSTLKLYDSVTSLLILKYLLIINTVSSVFREWGENTSGRKK